MEYSVFEILGLAVYAGIVYIAYVVLTGDFKILHDGEDDDLWK